MLTSINVTVRTVSAFAYLVACSVVSWLMSSHMFMLAATSYCHYLTYIFTYYTRWPTDRVKYGDFMLIVFSYKCVALVQLAGALQFATRGVSRAAAPHMKHKDYFTRLARAESGRMRLVIHKSNNHIYGQIVDDSADKVLCTASTMEKEVKESDASTRDCSAATEVGKRLGAKAVAAGIEKVHFDRKSYPYHGRVAALAAGAREAGLNF